MVVNSALWAGAELFCRLVALATMFHLARALGPAKFGVMEFAAGLLLWVGTLLTGGIDILLAREIARRPRMLRRFTDFACGFRLAVAAALFVPLWLWAGPAGPTDELRAVLLCYGGVMFAMAFGLDFVYLGTERTAWIALLQTVRIGGIAVGVWAVVWSPEHLVRAAVINLIAEAASRAAMVIEYTIRHGPVRLGPPDRLWAILLRRNLHVALTQLTRNTYFAADLMAVGFAAQWGRFSEDEVGWYASPRRLMVALGGLGLVLEKTLLAQLARSLAKPPEESRTLLDNAVRVLAMLFVPAAVGTTMLAGPLVEFLFGADFAPAAGLMALIIWRTPLHLLASLYQRTLIAFNREAVGLRLLFLLTAAGVPAIFAAAWLGGADAAAAAGLGLELLIVVTLWGLLRAMERAPAGHHGLLRPAAASAVMAAALWASADWPLLVRIPGGMAAYAVALVAVGGITPADLRRSQSPR